MVCKNISWCLQTGILFANFHHDVCKFIMFILQTGFEWCLILQIFCKLNRCLQIFKVLHLMKECFNYFNTLYEMYANNEDATLT